MMTVTFPISGMNEVELLGAGNYNLYVVAAGGVFDNLQVCSDVLCAPNTTPSVATTPIKVPEDSIINVCYPIKDDISDTHTASVCGEPKNGTLTYSVDNITKQLCVTYKPNANFEGQDEICLTICDNNAACTDVTIPITVQARPDPPSVISTPITVQTDTDIAQCFEIKDADKGDIFSAGVCGTTNGTAKVEIKNNNQVCLTYKSNKNYVGLIPFV